MHSNSFTSFNWNARTFQVVQQSTPRNTVVRQRWKRPTRQPQLYSQCFNTHDRAGLASPRSQRGPPKHTFAATTTATHHHRHPPPMPIQRYRRSNIANCATGPYTDAFQHPAIPKHVISGHVFEGVLTIQVTGDNYHYITPARTEVTPVRVRLDALMHICGQPDPTQRLAQLAHSSRLKRNALASTLLAHSAQRRLLRLRPQLREVDPRRLQLPHDRPTPAQRCIAWTHTSGSWYPLLQRYIKQDESAIPTNYRPTTYAIERATVA